MTGQDPMVTYRWLRAGERPGAWMAVASCFSFVRGMSPQKIVRLCGCIDVREENLAGDPEWEQAFSEDDLVAFIANDDWTVVYQVNGFPEQAASELAGRADVSECVIVFWNVNGVTEFSLYRGGTLLATLQPYSEPLGGAQPDLIADDVIDLQLDGDLPGPATEYYVRMMALAARITGVQLDADFLQRQVTIGQLADTAGAF